MKAGTVTLIVLVALSGCRLAPLHKPAGHPDFRLSESDIQYARALAHYGRGILAEHDSELSGREAAQHFLKAGQLDRESHRPYSRAALNLLKANMPDEALAALQEACEKDPHSIFRWIDLATMSHLLQRYQLAREAYNKALALDPEATFIRINLAKIDFVQQYDESALKLLEQGMQHEPESPAIISYVYDQAIEFIKLNAPERALPCLLFLADNVTDQRGRFLHLAGELKEQLKDPETAIALYRKAVRQPDALPETFLNLAVLRAESDITESISILSDGLKRYAGSPALLYAAGFLHAATGEYEKAVEQLDMFVEGVGRQQALRLGSDFLMVYASSKERIGAHDEAEVLFEHCIAYYPDHHEALNYLAYMWAELGINLETALEYVNRALAHEPENAAYIDTLGWIYFKMGRYDEALEELLKAHNILPDDPVVADHVGDVYLALGHRQNAIKFWRLSLKNAPENEDEIIAKMKKLDAVSNKGDLLNK